MRRAWTRLRRLGRRRQLDRDLEDELRFHLDMLAADHQDPRRQFGNFTALKEACREMWTFGPVEIWWQDLRYACRTLAKAPGFTLVAVTALALGIGANTTVFSLVNGILYKNLPFDDSDRILYLTRTDSATGEVGGGISYPDFHDLQAQTQSIEAMGGFIGLGCNVSDSATAPQAYRCSRVTANTFQIIGQKPAVGRDLRPEDERPGAPAVAILSFATWENRYGKDAGVIGKTIRINAQPTTVIGVMPKGILFPREGELWLPLIPTGDFEKREERTVSVFGRLRPGASQASAQAEMSTLAQRLASAHAENRGIGIRVQNYNQQAVPRKVQSVFLVLMGAVGFVLLIACANVANLMLARAVARGREISIRTALGASRWRVIRQLLIESLLLSAAGGTAGWLLAGWGIRAFDRAVIPTGKPAWIDFSIDLHVLLYLSAISIGTGLLFGLAPALRLSRVDVISALREGGRGLGSGLRKRRLSSVLVVAEMALAFVLLAGAGLMVRSFLASYAMPLGVDQQNVLTMRVELPEAAYGRPAQRVDFFQRLQSRLDALPGVESSVIASHLPGDGAPRRAYEVEGGAVDRKRPETALLTVGPGYFRAMRVPVRAGREFQESDGPSLVVINESLAAKAWPGRNAIGKQLRIGQNWLTVAGVVGNVQQDRSLSARGQPVAYLTYRQEANLSMRVLARTLVPPATLGDALRRTVQEVDPDQPVRDLMTLEYNTGLLNWPIRVFGSMFGIFAAIAFLLASIGLYAVIAHSVNQRTHEIGVRLAMGARGTDVRRMIVSQGMRPVAIGLVLGLGAALGMTRVLSALLEGVSPRDPLTLAAVSLALLTSAALGCLIPARRALRVDPAITLRHD